MLKALMCIGGRWQWRGALVLTAVWVGAFAVPDAQGQVFGRVEETESSVNYYYYHARPGEATVQVSVWGTIPQPGIYEVPDTTSLDKLMTMAGGAPLEARREGRDAPTITVQVYRPGPDGRRQIFEAQLTDLLNGNPQYPDFRDNDIVVVETVTPKSPFTWRDALSLTSTLGTLVLLGLRIFDRT
jgi:hypothetical protein